MVFFFGSLNNDNSLYLFGNIEPFSKRFANSLNLRGDDDAGRSPGSNDPFIQVNVIMLSTY